MQIYGYRFKEEDVFLMEVIQHVDDIKITSSLLDQTTDGSGPNGYEANDFFKKWIKCWNSTSSPAHKLDVNGDISANKIYANINVDDTRNIDESPTDFNKEVSFDFKTRATRCSGKDLKWNVYNRSLGDNSGGSHHQLNLNEGGLFWRQGQPDDATWAWNQVATNGMTQDFGFNGSVGIGLDSPE